MCLGKPIYAFNICIYDDIHGYFTINSIADIDRFIEDHAEIDSGIDICRMKQSALKKIYILLEILASTMNATSH